MINRFIFFNVSSPQNSTNEKNVNFFNFPYSLRKFIFFYFKKSNFLWFHYITNNNCSVHFFSKKGSTLYSSKFFICFIFLKNSLDTLFKGDFLEYKETKKLSSSIRFLSHDLKSALFNLQSYSEILYEYRYKIKEKQTLDFFEILNIEVSRIILLTSKLLEESNTRNKNNLLSLQNLYFIKSLLDSYRLNSLQKNIFLYQINVAFLNKVKSDQILICQILSNFINNSMRFTQFGGKLLIKSNSGVIFDLIVPRKSFFIRICIVDNGIGIQKILSLSNSNFRLNRLNQTGIGLDIVKKYLDAHRVKSHLYGFSLRGTINFFNLAS